MSYACAAGARHEFSGSATANHTNWTRLGSEVSSRAEENGSPIPSLTEAKLTTLLRDLLRGPTSVPPGPTAAVFQLLYHSQATKPLGETEFNQLLSQARQGNAARQITGLLV